MPININYPNFLNAPIQESSAANLFENLLKGYKMGKEPAKMAAEAKDKALATQLKQMEVEHKPTEYKYSDEHNRLANAISEEAYKHLPTQRAQEAGLNESTINKNNRVGTGAAGGPKASGDVANSLVLSDLATQLGANNPKYIAAKEAYDRGQKAKDSLIYSRDKYANSIAWRGLPAENKRHEIALATGMGLDPSAAEQDLTSGTTLSELAAKQKVNLKNVIPVYPVGQELIKQTQRRGAFVQELGVLDKHITEGLGKYQNKFLGYSLDQIGDAIKGEDPDLQGRVLAARALGPELNAVRARVAGTTLGIEMLRELQDKALTNMKIIESTVDSKTYVKMQHYMNLWLAEANQQFTTAINDYGRLNVGSPNLANINTGSNVGGKVDWTKHPEIGGQ